MRNSVSEVARRVQSVVHALLQTKAVTPDSLLASTEETLDCSFWKLPPEMRVDTIVNALHLVHSLGLHLKAMRENEEMEPAELVDLEAGLMDLCTKWIEDLRSADPDQFHRLLDILLLSSSPSLLLFLLNARACQDEVFRFLKSTWENISRFVNGWGGGAEPMPLVERIDENTLQTLQTNTLKVQQICKALKDRLHSLSALLEEAIRHRLFKIDEVEDLLFYLRFFEKEILQPTAMGEDRFLWLRKVLYKGAVAFQEFEVRVQNEARSWVEDTSRSSVFESTKETKEQVESAFQELKKFLSTPFSSSSENGVWLRQIQNLDALRGIYIANEARFGMEVLKWLELPFETKLVRKEGPLSREEFEKAQIEMQDFFSNILQRHIKALRPLLLLLHSGAQEVMCEEGEEGKNDAERLLQRQWKTPEDILDVKNLTDRLQAIAASVLQGSSRQLRNRFLQAYLTSWCAMEREEVPSDPSLISFLTQFTQSFAHIDCSKLKTTPGAVKVAVKNLGFEIVGMKDEFLGLCKVLKNISPVKLDEKLKFSSFSLQLLSQPTSIEDLISAVSAIRGMLREAKRTAIAEMFQRYDCLTKSQEQFRATLADEYGKIANCLQGVDDEKMGYLRPLIELSERIKCVFSDSQDLLEVRAKLSIYRGDIEERAFLSFAGAKKARKTSEAKVATQYLQLQQEIQNALERVENFAQAEKEYHGGFQGILEEFRQYSDECNSASQIISFKERAYALKNLKNRWAESFSKVRAFLRGIVERKQRALSDENRAKYKDIFSRLLGLQKRLEKERDDGNSEGRLGACSWLTAVNGGIGELVSQYRALSYSLLEQKKFLESCEMSLSQMEARLEKEIFQPRHVKIKIPSEIFEDRLSTQVSESSVLDKAQKLVFQLAREKTTQQLLYGDYLLKARDRYGVPEVILKKKLGESPSQVVWSMVTRTSSSPTVVTYVKPKAKTPEGRRWIQEVIEVSRSCRAGLSEEESNIIQMDEVRGVKVPTKVKGYTMKAYVGNAAEFLKKTQLSQKEVLDLFQQAANGLSHMHERGLSHNNIKLENLLISKEGKKVTVLLSDFSLSSPGSEQGTVRGTYSLLAPEVLGVTNRDQNALVTLFGNVRNAVEGYFGMAPNFARDCFALGMTFLEGLEGKNANNLNGLEISDFEGEDQSCWMNAYNEIINSLSSTIPIENLILRLIDLDPHKRPSAAEVRDEIRSIMS